MKAPHPIRTAKLSTVGLDQYFGRGLQGNLQCCMAFLFFFLNPLEIFIFAFSGKPRNFFLSRICEEDAQPAVSTRILFTGQGGGVICYTHEAEERNKKNYF